MAEADASRRITPPPVPRPVPHLTIKPRSRWVLVNVRELWEFRDLLRSFGARDITLRYRQTALGVTWAVLQPLIASAIFAFVFGRVAKLPSHGVPYLVFAFAGLLAWNAFSSTLSKASSSLVGNVGMVSKVFFPRMLLPLSVLGSTLLDFAVSVVVLGVMMAVYRIAPSAAILLLPIWLLLVLMLATGLGLAAAALSVPYRDVQYVLPVLLQFLLYASPVAYALNAVPLRLRPIMAINPLTGLLEAFRWSLLDVGRLPVLAVVWSAIAAILVLLIGAFLFAAMERDFADVI